MKHILLISLSALLIGCAPLLSAQQTAAPDDTTSTSRFDALTISTALSSTSPASAPPARMEISGSNISGSNNSSSNVSGFATELQRARANVQTMDLTSQSADIWTRMRRGFGMPNLENPIVDKHLAAFTAHPQAVTNILERGRKYMYHIVVELEKRGMPTEMALLPLVESAYNPMAFSSAKAAGLWQFIPSTGKDFQLQQNWWVDERRDVLASTTAALTYLQAVYELQGDWHLALASYNWGENAVLRAVNSNRNAGKPTDFNSLRMPAETAQYVPKLQAIKMIVAHPERYGIKLPNIPNEPYFVTVERTQGMDVAVAARFAEMPTSEFQALNPAFNRPVIPGSHSADLVLPVENANKFRENLAAHAGQSLISWKTYTVPRTARVEEVAQRLRLSSDVLRSANGLAPRARLAAGYTLLIPQTTDTELATTKPGKIASVRQSPPRALSKAMKRPVAARKSGPRS
ncbi:transglycosylase SLT domain-containing protein [Uliginosibacterium flavum]|uniref:Transglycosylase SLT domain-containing protein n=1 Tax=Uliginosibacterium flavum TaxID=1396831 RepID=A0ABV2TIP8_9RHOO